MRKHYFREPAIQINEPADYNFAFTMRMLNFLRQLRAIKHQPSELYVAHYAKRMWQRPFSRR